LSAVDDFLVVLDADAKSERLGFERHAVFVESVVRVPGAMPACKDNGVRRKDAGACTHPEKHTLFDGETVYAGGETNVGAE
jgi:hypothetical protein